MMVKTKAGPELESVCGHQPVMGLPSSAAASIHLRHVDGLCGSNELKTHL